MSTGGYCVYLGGNLLSWSARKQKVVSKSSTEAEYMALSHGASELIWVKSLLSDLEYKIEATPAIWYVIALAEILYFTLEQST